MVAASGNRIAWTYTADDGTDYRVAAKKELTDQALLGGADGSAVATSKPADIKMRRITCHSATYGSRVVPVYEVGAPICTKGTSININVDGTLRAFTSSGNPIPQSHKRQSVTSQAS
jgi:hypothetical protein